MRAGQLDQRVTVLRPVETRSASGEVVTTYEADTAIGDAGAVWASILPLSGNRFFAADQLQTKVTHEVRVRYQDGYRSHHRIRHEAEPGKFREFAIDAVLPLASDRHRLSLMCVLRETTGWQ